MTTTVYTQSICDKCGKKEVRPGPYAQGTLPDGWVTFVYSWKDHEDIQKDLCPACDKAVSSVLTGTNPPEPEKKPRQKRSDANKKGNNILDSGEWGGVS